MDAPYLLGRTNVVVFGPLRFWPERGIVCCEDGRDNSFVQLSIKEALLRTKGINDMLGRSSDCGGYEDERVYHQRFVEEMMDIIRIAKEQGSPDDPSACRDLARRRPKAIRITHTLGMD